MKRLNTFFRYILCFVLMLFVMLVLNIIVMGYISGTFDESKRIAASISVTAAELKFDSGSAFMTEKGRARIDSLDGFAILIDETGEVIWEYNKPADVPAHFSLSDVASFSRWYLCDYPVYSHIIDLPDGGRGIFVLGQPKGSLWKYQLSVGINSLRRYPYIFAADMIFLFIVPLFITKRSVRKSERERTEWIAGVSHDIRTPLTMAMLCTSKIISESSDKDAAEAARQILSHEQHMKGLVENLNAENRLRYGYGRRVRERVNLPSVIRNVLCDFADANDGLPFGFECVISPDAEDCVIRCDEALVRRMLENIIGNSVRHNPGGCTVSIRLCRRKSSRLCRSCILSISDDGCGAPPEVAAALNSGHKAGSLREHGIGLRVVSRIAKRYHWRIKYTSAPGEGFAVRILVRM